MKTLAAIALLVTTSFAAPPEALQYDFTPPAYPDDQAGQIFHYYMPPADGFSANINLIAQPYNDTLQAYDELSQAEFEQLDLDLIRNELANGVLTYEYKGRVQNIDLHWYARATKKGDKIYLITATALADRWETDSPALVESVNSFALKHGGVN